MQFKSIGDIETLLAKIPKFQDRGLKAARFELRPFEQLCEALGSPQEGLRAIHVAGTNGKGSTCRLLASVYHASGYKTGLYTSPHLVRFTERFVISGREISEKRLLEFFNSYYPVIEEFQPTYFELMTAIAFWWFKREGVDLAVIETGLGGRLDATNIIQPLLSVITNVSLDHVDILGNTIEEIAREKAGIIKPGIPVVTGNISPEAGHIVGKTAKENGSTVHGIESLSPQWKEGTVRLQANSREMVIPTGMRAPVQKFNIAMAWRAIEVLGEVFPVEKNDFIEGIKKADTLYPAPGRFERLLEGREWYFDGAHNLEAIAAMKEMIREAGAVDDSVLVLSMMSDKFNKKVAEEFLEFKKIFYHTLDTERAATMEEIQRMLPGVKPFPADIESIYSFLKDYETELVIFAGSFYFYSAVRDWITHYVQNR